ncbi:hypothetical protein DMH26_28580 [Streptomyces sp. WAC 05379]|nr:hypothetical protein DMH26_28580 [Streptomyces sp. WAC 05379]
MSGCTCCLCSEPGRIRELDDQQGDNVDTGDWIAVGAVVISVAAAIISVWQAHTAVVSAGHAKVMTLLAAARIAHTQGTEITVRNASPQARAALHTLGWDWLRSDHDE